MFVVLLLTCYCSVMHNPQVSCILLKFREKSFDGICAGLDIRCCILAAWTLRQGCCRVGHNNYLMQREEFGSFHFREMFVQPRLRLKLDLEPANLPGIQFTPTE